jgi:hypothetical protein
VKIENLRTENEGNRPRVTATVTWEDCDRPSLDVYFETEEEFGQDLTCNPHAFLVGSILPAMHHGEKRVFIDAEICPELRENLITAMLWVRHWFYEAGPALVEIESGVKTGLQSPRTPERTGMFFSGGIDSYGTLCANRLNYPEGHPGSIKDGLLLYGQNIESDNRPETFAKAYSVLSGVAKDSGVVLIPVYTNIRLLDESSRMFAINHGAILGAVAHVFSRRLTTVCIAAGDSIPGLRYFNKLLFIPPFGSHPLLDPCYGSSDLRIRHDGLSLSRLDKTKLIAGWDVALRNIKVCGPNWPGSNCGRCEKCIRTMLGLVAAGVLEKTDAFPLDDVSAELAAKVHFKKPIYGYTVEQDYLELIAPLREKGRIDLVNAIEQAVWRVHHRKKSFYARIKEMDSKYLSGTLARTKRLVRPPGKKKTLET